MRSLLVCLFLLGAKTFADENCSCGWTNKAAEGEDKKVNEFPFMVALINPSSKFVFCGGTIITPRHVLTAAHCTFRYSESRRLPAVVVGEVNANNLEKEDVTAATYNVERIIEHFDHNRLSQKNDIALLYLERSIPFDGEFGPACLPSGHIDLDGKKVKALGWARIAKTKEEYYDGLVREELDAAKVQKCIDSSGVPMVIKDDETICTLTSGSQELLCENDNGGPLLYHDPTTKKHIVAGITSYGSHCANGKPGLSLAVAHYIDWIQRKINETAPDQHICTAS